MNRNQLIKHIESKLGFKVVEIRYFSKFRNCPAFCWDIELEDMRGERYFIEANTLPELLSEIIEQLL